MGLDEESLTSREKPTEEEIKTQSTKEKELQKYHCNIGTFTVVYYLHWTKSAHTISCRRPTTRKPKILLSCIAIYNIDKDDLLIAFPAELHNLLESIKPQKDRGNRRNLDNRS